MQGVDHHVSDEANLAFVDALAEIFEAAGLGAKSRSEIASVSNRLISSGI